jgi:trehalose/maltose hydrolase-like predicted phosphorylase
MLWDTDLWHFRAVNALWPKLGRQSVRARLALLPGARRRAAELGLPGAWFGWVCDEEGNEIAPLHYQAEIHVNAWIVLSAWESACSSDDPAWKEEVYPLLASVADATCGRAQRDADGSWHLRQVVPPDESVTENPLNPGTCDDAVSTNLAFRAALRVATTAARQLGREAPALWSEVADGLVVLPPGPDGVIPEYSGYTGHPIKQADLILSFWPLETDYPDEVVRANLDYYGERCGNGGPLMTAQIDACIRLRRGIGLRETVLTDFITRYRRHVHGAFEVPYECIGNSNSVFLTGCGGLLQALVFGWFGVQKPEEFTRVPRLACT